MTTDSTRKALISYRLSLVFRGAVLLLGLSLIVLVFGDDVRIAGGDGFGITQALVLAIGLLNVVASFLSMRLLPLVIMGQLSGIATLLVAELILAATVSHIYKSPYQLEPRYLYNLVPGARRQHRHLPVNGGTQIYQVNSLGFRGEEFTAVRTDKARVVIYGDSFIHAEYTALEDTLARQLEMMLSTRVGRPVEVINAGVAGYGPDQVLRRIEDELGWLQPDLLVVAVFAGNDYGDLLRNKIYRLGADGELIENDYFFSDEIVLNATLEVSELMLRKVGRQAKVAILERVRGATIYPSEPIERTEFRLQQHLREYQEYILDGDNEVRELKSDPYSADISLLPGSPSAEYKLALMDAVLARMSDTAASHKVPILLLSIPHPMDVMNGDHESGAVDYDKYPDYLPSRLTDSLEASATQHRIDHINLFPYFRATDDPAALYLLGGDDHWNNAGQRYAAELLTERIVQRSYIGTIARD